MNTTLTAHNESLVLYLYDDHNGKAVSTGDVLLGTGTIGYGIAVSKPYGGITLDEADFLLLYRLWGIRRALAGRFTNWDDLSEARRAVLADVAFNRGLGHFDEMNLKQTVERGDFVLVAKVISGCPAAKQDHMRYALLADIMASDRMPDNLFPSHAPDLSESVLAFINDLED